MTIHLPNDLKTSIEAVVHSGRFASVDDAMAEAARLLLQQIQHEQSASSAVAKASTDPLLGAWREDAALLDEIVEHAMKVRDERPWRLAPGE